ncbi:putative lipid-transfer protein DIR1 [Macadamia integrifolia]|uniref:putative lipid-transfer protein DIR1 n=1 Tax=Macadamia integrifolia TaxID=60698 RepID=UPI001C4F271A|nr:putative lipid-transfer protein DIR1 [Macadamia integrifolia]
MEAFRKLVVVVSVMAVVLGNEVMVSQAQTILCNLTGADISSCKPFVTPGNTAQPSDLCCAALSHADFKCLCSFKNSKWLSTFGIDPNFAMQLPAKCKLSQVVQC